MLHKYFVVVVVVCLFCFLFVFVLFVLFVVVFWRGFEFLRGFWWCLVLIVFGGRLLFFFECMCVCFIFCLFFD